MRKTKYSKEQYINAQEKEKKDIDNLYSKLLIATNDNAQITISVEDLKTLISEEVKKQIKDYGNNAIYPVLYKNDQGWNSGNITIEGLSQYEEIGVYVSTATESISKESSKMIRCIRSVDGDFSGGYNSIYKGSNSKIHCCINLSINGDTLIYNKCAMLSETTVKQNNTKIYKIVGLTKKSQIVE